MMYIGSYAVKLSKNDIFQLKYQTMLSDINCWPNSDKKLLSTRSPVITFFLGLDYNIDASELLLQKPRMRKKD